MTQTLHFAHANGIPTATYGTMLSELSHHYRVCSIPVLGHDPAYPVTNNWVHLRKQLIHSVESANRGPVIGVGHSLGGALTILAALERPELFSQVIVLDVPTFSHLEAMTVYAAKKFGFIDHLTPAKKSRTRRTQWSTRDEAKAYFKTKALFAQFHDQCLQDYVDHALTETEAGNVELGYRLDVELAVFRTVPHKMVLNGSHLKMPMAVIAGKESTTVRQYQYRRMTSKVGFTGRLVEGSHMFPLEHPIETARQIHHVIHQIGRRR